LGISSVTVRSLRARIPLSEFMKTKISADPSSDVSDQATNAGGSDPSLIYRNLLVPIDFSEHSEKTLEHAAKLAGLAGASVKILHVIKIPEYPAAFYQGLYLEHDQIRAYLDVAKRDATKHLSLVTERILGKGLDAEGLIRVGNPFEEIVNAAKETGVDLIVIGSHGSGGLGRLLLGSTAERVIQYAPCPVLVVKEAAGK
jgi:universal stress protein A